MSADGFDSPGKAAFRPKNQAKNSEIQAKNSDQKFRPKIQTKNSGKKFQAKNSNVQVPSLPSYK
jgi:hypothetical protein